MQSVSKTASIRLKGFGRIVTGDHANGNARSLTVPDGTWHLSTHCRHSTAPDAWQEGTQFVAVELTLPAMPHASSPITTESCCCFGHPIKEPPTNAPYIQQKNGAHNNCQRIAIPCPNNTHMGLQQPAAQSAPSHVGLAVDCQPLPHVLTTSTSSQTKT